MAEKTVTERTASVFQNIFCAREQEVAPGVTATTCVWGVAYSGKAENLIAAGVIEEEWLPGKPGQRKTVGYGERNGVKITVHKRSKWLLDVSVPFSDEELQSYGIIEQTALADTGQQQNSCAPEPNNFPVEHSPDDGDLSRAENELICYFRKCSGGMRRTLLELVSRLPKDAPPARNIIDFEAYKLDKGLPPFCYRPRDLRP